MIYVILEALDLQYVKQFTLNKIVLFKIFKNIYIRICIFVVDSKLFFCGFKESLIRFRDFASSYNYNFIQSFQTLRFGSRARRRSKKNDTTHLTTILERQNFYMLVSCNMMMPKIVNKLHNTHVLKTRLVKQTQRKLGRVPVWYRPKPLRRLCQRTFHNSRVSELG